MKKLIKLLPLLGTIFAVAVGLMLPHIVSMVQDQTLETKVITYETDNIQFRSASKVTESLRLVSSGYEQIHLENDHTLNTNSAYQAARNAAQYLADQGVSEANLSDDVHHDEVPFLAVSTDESITALLWHCRLYEEESNNRLELLIDDNSGKMLAFLLSTQNEASDLTYKLADITADYYGLTVDSIEMDRQTYTVQGSITMVGEMDEFLTFPLLIFENSFLFNSTSFFENSFSTSISPNY